MAVGLVVHLVADMAVTGVDVADSGAAVLTEHYYVALAADNVAMVGVDVSFGCDSDSLV